MFSILHARHFFDDVKPINFATFATPHLGLVRYKTLFSKLANWIGPRLLSRTGEQFFSRDKWGATGEPLLKVMADKSAHACFLRSATGVMTRPC